MHDESHVTGEQSRHALRSNLSRAGKRAILRLALESLEARHLLAGAGPDYESVSADWFSKGPRAIRPARSFPLGAASASKFIGPVRPLENVAVDHREWIVRLREDVTRQLDAIDAVDALLDSEHVNFDVVRGLGLPGMVLVESFAAGDQLAEQTLEANEFVSFYSPNEVVSGTIEPNDSEFGNMTGLSNAGQFGGTINADTDATDAWDVTRRRCLGRCRRD